MLGGQFEAFSVFCFRHLEDIVHEVTAMAGSFLKRVFPEIASAMETKEGCNFVDPSGNIFAGVCFHCYGRLQKERQTCAFGGTLPHHPSPPPKKGKKKNWAKFRTQY